ncbi:monooxygenase [Dactylosporangium sp. CA-139066]|uniref:monooxygenase n=1 Tax=Dactylosporangium sp. CA-139066 TaxID=3239930 RepID=UPI003D9131FB
MFWSMAVDRRKIRKNADFAKLLGTGRGSDFGVGAADLTRWAALIVADRAVIPPMRGARASCTLTLEPIASRGTWSRSAPFTPINPEKSGMDDGGEREIRKGDKGEEEEQGRRGGGDSGPVAVLTRARLRPRQAVAFWRAIDPVARSLRDAEGLYCAFGVGEAPVGFQGTVSVWRSAADVVRFAYRRPEHAAVVQRTAAQRWYAEELFARFRVLGIDGDREVIGWRDGQ